MKTNELSHDDICLIGKKFLERHNFGVVFHDKFRGFTKTGEQPDVIGFRNGVSCLLEAKCSRSDFLADFNKPFRVNNKGMGNWRFYISEPHVISVEDLPEGWGLLHIKNNRVYKVHGFPANTEWFNFPFDANLDAERDYMYSALRRMQIFGYLNEIYNK